MFLDNAKTEFYGFFAGRGEVYTCVVILRGKDRFVRLDKGQHFFLPTIEEIIFDDGKIEMVY